MSTGDSAEFLEAFAPPDYFPPRQLYLPSQPLTWALDRIDTALRDIRTASVTGWRSVLAEVYRDQLDDLTRDLMRARELALAAERAYGQLRYVAQVNGE